MPHGKRARSRGTSLDSWQTFRAEEDEDRRRLHRAIGVAVVFHLLLLPINLPSWSAAEEVAPPPVRVYVMEETRFKRPPPREQEVLRRISRRVPVPDQTPDDPEPIRPLEPEEFLLDEVDDFLPAIPESAPDPEPDGPIHVLGEVQKPIKLYTPAPQYTEIARKARVQGPVIVQAVIDQQGHVTQVEVLKGLRMGLTEAAVAAVQQWRFQPATLGGRPVAVYFNLTVIFELE